MVTFKKFKYIIFSLLAIAVIASATAFSVSYAKWVSPANDSLGANLSTGEWETVTTTIDNGVVVGNKGYNSFPQGNDIYKCVFKVKHKDKFSIYCTDANGTRALTYTPENSDWFGSATGIAINGTEFSYNKDFSSAFGKYNGNEEQFIEVTFHKDGILSISVASFDSLNLDEVKEILNANSCIRGILTSDGEVISFDALSNEKIINIENGKQFYIVDVNFVRPEDADGYLANINSDALRSNSNNNSTIYTMKGNGTISVRNSADGIEIVVSVENSNQQTKIFRNSIGLWIVEYKNS